MKSRRAVNRSGDDATALRLLDPLANQGYVPAQMTLGSMYQFGRGVPQGYSAAAKWFRKAADQGYAPAQLSLGYMYAEGLGVPQNDVQAYKWYSLAVAGLPVSNTENRENAIKYRDHLAAKMTPDQVAEAQKLASEWKPSGP